MFLCDCFFYFFFFFFFILEICECIKGNGFDNTKPQSCFPSGRDVFANTGEQPTLTFGTFGSDMHVDNTSNNNNNNNNNKNNNNNNNNNFTFSMDVDNNSNNNNNNNMSSTVGFSDSNGFNFGGNTFDNNNGGQQFGFGATFGQSNDEQDVKNDPSTNQTGATKAFINFDSIDDHGTNSNSNGNTNVNVNTTINTNTIPRGDVNNNNNNTNTNTNTNTQTNVIVDTNNNGNSTITTVAKKEDHVNNDIGDEKTVPITIIKTKKTTTVTRTVAKRKPKAKAPAKSRSHSALALDERHSEKMHEREPSIGTTSSRTLTPTPPMIKELQGGESSSNSATPPALKSTPPPSASSVLTDKRVKRTPVPVTVGGEGKGGDGGVIVNVNVYDKKPVNRMDDKHEEADDIDVHSQSSNQAVVTGDDGNSVILHGSSGSESKPGQIDVTPKVDNYRNYNYGNYPQSQSQSQPKSRSQTNRYRTDMQPQTLVYEDSAVMTQQGLNAPQRKNGSNFSDTNHHHHGMNDSEHYSNNNNNNNSNNNNNFHGNTTHSSVISGWPTSFGGDTNVTTNSTFGNVDHDMNNNNNNINNDRRNNEMNWQNNFGNDRNEYGYDYHEPHEAQQNQEYLQHQHEHHPMEQHEQPNFGNQVSSGGFGATFGGSGPMTFNSNFNTNGNVNGSVNGNVNGTVNGGVGVGVGSYSATVNVNRNPIGNRRESGLTNRDATAINSLIDNQQREDPKQGKRITRNINININRDKEREREEQDREQEHGREQLEPELIKQEASLMNKLELPVHIKKQLENQPMVLKFVESIYNRMRYLEMARDELRVLNRRARKKIEEKNSIIKQGKLEKRTNAKLVDMCSSYKHENNVRQRRIDHLTRENFKQYLQISNLKVYEKFMIDNNLIDLDFDKSRGNRALAEMNFHFNTAMTGDATKLQESKLPFALREHQEKLKEMYNEKLIQTDLSLLDSEKNRLRKHSKSGKSEEIEFKNIEENENEDYPISGIRAINHGMFIFCQNITFKFVLH